MKASVFIATSLDGFIARPDGALDWLPGAEPDGGGREEDAVENGGEVEDYGWGAFWDSVDCLVFGRKTFEKVLEFGLWPYEGTRVIVLSRTLTAVPQELQGKTEIYAGDPQALVDKLAAEGHERLYVDGGQTIQSFLRRGLINDLTINTIPVLIGEGIPLFGPLPEDMPLRHVKTESYPTGFVLSTYEV
jgi:dihydrofolate reductase